MLEIKKLTINFEEFMFGPISFSLAKGQRIAIMGESGAGKTTLLKTIIGLIPPSCGEIVLDKKDITYTPPQRRGMSIVTQNPLLFPHMNVYENITFGIPGHKINKEKKANELMNLVHITRFSKRYTKKLSGGEKQRVALARALFVEPKILLLDEPFSSLDEDLKKNLQKEVLILWERLKFSMIIVTHNREEASVMGDEILKIQKGKLIL